MDTVRFGRQARALRRRRGWRQADLAAAAKVSRPLISRVERGHADQLTLAAVEAIAKALGARLNLVMTWNGEALDRLLDADHAALVDIVAATLRTLEWLVAVEVSFNIRGEWGSIDVLAFHPATGVVLVVEVKSVVPDLQATIFTLDRKTRLGLEIAAERGWHGRLVGRLLVVADGRTTRRRVAEHRGHLRRRVSSPDGGGEALARSAGWVEAILRPLVSGKCSPDERSATSGRPSDATASVTGRESGHGFGKCVRTGPFASNSSPNAQDTIICRKDWGRCCPRAERYVARAGHGHRRVAATGSASGASSASPRPPGP